MKTIITLAVAVAALATASVAPARNGAAGHYEWRDAPLAGPRAIAHRVRLWVVDGQASMANCDCSKMKADGCGSMMDMSGKGRTPSTS